MTLESKQVDIKLGGETKSVSIFRYSADHCWICSQPVLVRYPTGKKIHRTVLSTVHERKDGTLFLQAAYRNSHRAAVYAWDSSAIAISKWRG